MSELISHPTVTRKALIKGAGVFWSIGGIFLVVRAFILPANTQMNWIVIVPAALFISFFKYKFMFSKIVGENLNRIASLSPQKERICLFAFQSIESYLLIIVMITTSIFLRTLNIPSYLLSTLFIAIGVALFFASLLYYKAYKKL